MTDYERFAAMSAISKGHPILACRINGCPICKAYYKVLLTPTTRLK